MTLTEYTSAVAQRVEVMMEIPSGELLEDEDPYDVREFIKHAHEIGLSPSACADELFGEDYDSRLNDEQMSLEAEESNDE